MIDLDFLFAMAANDNHVQELVRGKNAKNKAEHEEVQACGFSELACIGNGNTADKPRCFSRMAKFKTADSQLQD